MLTLSQVTSRALVLAAGLLVAGSSVSHGAKPLRGRIAGGIRRSVRRPAFPPRQPVAKLAGLYALSIAALPRYRSTMVRYAERRGGRFHAAPLKRPGRASEKVNGQLGGDTAKLTDVVRGTIELPDLRSLYATLADLEAGERVVMVKDRLQNRTLGYPHVNVRLAMRGGLVVEVQLTIRPFFEVFHGSVGVHALYEEFRLLDQRRATLTPTEWARRRRLIAEMRERFDRVPSPYKEELVELQREPSFRAQFGDLQDP